MTATLLLFAYYLRNNIAGHTIMAGRPLIRRESSCIHASCVPPGALYQARRTVQPHTRFKRVLPHVLQHAYCTCMTSNPKIKGSMKRCTAKCGSCRWSRQWDEAGSKPFYSNLCVHPHHFLLGTMRVFNIFSRAYICWALTTMQRMQLQRILRAKYTPGCVHTWFLGFLIHIILPIINCPRNSCHLNNSYGSKNSTSILDMRMYLLVDLGLNPVCSP